MAEESEIAKQVHIDAQVLLKQQCLCAIFKSSAANMAIAHFFYSNAILFSGASSDETSLFHTMVRAVQKVPASYVPPNAKKLEGSLLDESFDGMCCKIEARDPNGTLKEKFGACCASDGRDSCDSLPLINSAFISNNDGGMYWRSVDTSGPPSTAHF